MQEKISIIVPVYNVADYLNEALDSIISQNYCNFEVICVNDGSTDNSLSILEEYAQKDKRFVVINQPNGGVARARNVGLDHATGDYVMFLDPDDYYVSGTFDLVLNKIKEKDSDICLFSGANLYVNNDKKFVKKFKLNLRNNEEDTGLEYGFSLLKRIYKRSFIEKNKIRFIEGLKTCEDIIFVTLLTFLKPRIDFLDEALYVVRQNRPGSATTNNVNGIKTDLYALKKLYSFPIYQEQGYGMRKLIANRWLYSGVFYYNRIKTIKDILIVRKDIKDLIKFIKKNNKDIDLNNLEHYRQLKNLLSFKMFLNSLKKQVVPADYDEYLRAVNFEQRLNKLSKKIKNKKVLFYGAGSFFEYVYKKYDFKSFNVVGISDKKFSESKAGENFNNIKIIPVSQIREISPDYVLVTNLKYDGIVNILRENDFKNSTVKVEPLVKVPENIVINSMFL